MLRSALLLSRLGAYVFCLLFVFQLKDVTDKIYKGFQCNLKEFTVEGNPCTVDNEKLTALKDCGVGRLSIGVQSAHIQGIDVVFISVLLRRDINLSLKIFDILASLRKRICRGYKVAVSAPRFAKRHVQIYSKT